MRKYRLMPQMDTVKGTNRHRATTMLRPQIMLTANELHHRLGSRFVKESSIPLSAAWISQRHVLVTPLSGSALEMIDPATQNP